MSSETTFDLRWATPDDEPDIRALVGSVPMPGAVAVRFAREPDYFLGAAIMGDPCDVLVARHRFEWLQASVDIGSSTSGQSVSGMRALPDCSTWALSPPRIRVPANCLWAPDCLQVCTQRGYAG
jgi:hypothetical protein